MNSLGEFVVTVALYVFLLWGLLVIILIIKEKYFSSAGDWLVGLIFAVIGLGIAGIFLFVFNHIQFM